jgi:beta-lactamase superfamily II metal-dependent hydrolase
MIFSLEVRPARKGDCLMVHYGSKEDPGLMLIDGGPAQVYKPSLKPRLTQIRTVRGLGSTESLEVDIMMVSHIDDDHIRGILELTSELVDDINAKKPLPLKIRSLWHNTFDKIIGNKPDELLAAVTASYGAASLGGEPDTEGLDPGAAKVLASVDQGLHLGDDARRLKLPVNPEFDGKLVMAKEDGKTIDMKKGGLKLTVAGPMQAELVALQKEYDDFLKKHPDDRKTTASLAAFTDNSVPNLSSIVVLAEADGKRMLFTGDARGDKILEGLELVGLLKKGDKMHVDIVKAPHHGSSRNLDPIFFRRLTADHYVFSADGEYGNPERETLQMLLDERGDAEFTIHLTYPIDKIDVEREKDWNKEQQKKAKKSRDPKAEVREDWSPEKHSLTAFFENNKNLAKKLSILEASKPHLIDLLEEVGF